MPKTVKVIRAAEALLKKIDTITTDEFARGGERREREVLRHALLDLKRGAQR